MPERRPMASVYDSPDRAAWLVAETPSEAADKVKAARDENDALVEFTLANPDSEWNGRTLYVDPFAVRAITPPLDYENDDDA